jgi:hypothetical protein
MTETVEYEYRYQKVKLENVTIKKSKPQWKAVTFLPGFNPEIVRSSKDGAYLAAQVMIDNYYVRNVGKRT